MIDDPAPGSVITPFLGDGVGLAGAFDFVDARHGLRGWLVQPQGFARPLPVEAWCGLTRLARSITALDRPGIDKILNRRTECGFLIGWSRFDRDALTRIAEATPEAEVQVRHGDSALTLPATGPRLTADQALRLLTAAPLGDRGPAFAGLNAAIEVEASGLFDADWYMRQYGDDLAGQGLPLLHYLTRGESEGRRPNLYFDPQAYGQAAGLPAGAPRLLHYLRQAPGARSGAGVQFDADWYRASHGLDGTVCALAHYLAHRGETCPNAVVTASLLHKTSRASPEADPYEAYLRAELRKRGGRRVEGARAALLADAARLFAAAPKSAGPPLAGPQPPERQSTGPQSTRPQSPGAQSPEPEALARQTVAPESPGPKSPAPVASPPPSPASDEAQSLEHLRGLTDLSGLMALAGPPDPAPEAGPVRALLRRLQAAAAALRAGQGDLAAQDLAGCVAALNAEPLREAGYDAGPLLTRLLAWAHGEWRGLRSPGVLSLFQALRQVGVHDRMALIRILEAEVAARDIDAAGRVAEDLVRLYPDGVTDWALIALARLALLRADLAAAADLLCRIPAPPASEVLLFSNAIILLTEAGDIAGARARLALMETTTSKELQIARVRIAVRAGDWAALTRALTRDDIAQVPAWVLAEAVHQKLDTGQTPGADQREAEEILIRALTPLAATLSEALMALTPLLIKRRRFAELDAVFARVAGLPLADAPAVQIRKLEFLCRSGRLAEALDLYRARLTGITLGKWEGMTVLRLLGEARLWPEAGRLILDHVSQGYGFAGAVHSALRVVRRTGLHANLAELAASGAITPGRDPEVDRFLALVAADGALRQAAQRVRDGGAAKRSGLGAPVLDAPGLDAPGLDAPDGGCLFLCANRQYFLPLLTFLCSCLGQALQTRAPLHVFLDRDVPLAWHAALTLVADRFEGRVEIIAEADFMPEGVAHKADYGFFSGGRSLSRAAYFRLYAARHLMARARVTRALYVDCDIVCRGDLTPLIGLDLHGAPLAARIEDDGLEVREAAESNGLDPARYFNSGVLLLDFGHADLGALLDRAIRLSEEEQERLVFHDQCALNIAFQGRFHVLPEAFNFYLRPHRERNGYIEDGVLLHFLDKPKPWDIAFARNYLEEWRVWAVQLGMILPDALYIDMLAAANEE